jgi:hypothetical protein
VEPPLLSVGKLIDQTKPAEQFSLELNLARIAPNSSREELVREDAIPFSIVIGESEILVRNFWSERESQQESFNEFGLILDDCGAGFEPL